jgi:hypothetical protein
MDAHYSVGSTEFDSPTENVHYPGNIETIFNVEVPMWIAYTFANSSMAVFFLNFTWTPLAVPKLAPIHSLP